MQSKPLVQDLDPHFNAPTISHVMAKTKISNKKDTYNSMIANGYLLAALTSTCMTIAYMDGVRKKKFWVPNFKTAKMGPCPYPPKKELWYIEVVNECNN